MRRDNYEPVTEDVFQQFIAAYPRPLTRNTLSIADPMIREWHDFTLGQASNQSSVVAFFTLYDPKDSNIWNTTPSGWHIRRSTEAT